MPNLQEAGPGSRCALGTFREVFGSGTEIGKIRLDLGAQRPTESEMCWLLAEEAPVAAFRAEAWIKAGESLRKAERLSGLALEHLEHGLEN